MIKCARRVQPRSRDKFRPLSVFEGGSTRKKLSCGLSIITPLLRTHKNDVHLPTSQAPSDGAPAVTRHTTRRHLNKTKQNKIISSGALRHQMDDADTKEKPVHEKSAKTKKTETSKKSHQKIQHSNFALGISFTIELPPFYGWPNGTASSPDQQESRCRPLLPTSDGAPYHVAFEATAAPTS